MAALANAPFGPLMWISDRLDVELSICDCRSVRFALRVRSLSRDAGSSSSRRPASTMPTTRDTAPSV